MRILIVAHGFPPRDPGVWTINLARVLATRHSVWIYARANDGAQPTFYQWEERASPISVRYVINNVVNPMEWFSMEHLTPIDERFAAFLDEVQPDVVHFEHLIGLSVTMLAHTQARGIPSVLALYDHWWVCPRINLVRGDHSRCPGPSHAYDCVRCVEGGAEGPPEQWRLILHDARFSLMRTLFDYPDVITACSHYLRDYMTAAYFLPSDRIRAVNLGIPPLAGAVVHRPSDRIRIAYLGSVMPHKGIHILAEAMQLIANPRVETHLYGYAPPSYAQELRAINERMVFHGPYQREALPTILSEIDILVLPTLAPETFSLVIREAAQARVPVIASRIGAIPEYIRDGETGLLVEPGNARALAAALARLIADPSLRESLAASPNPFRTVEDYAGQMEDLYFQIVGARGAYANGHAS